MKTTTKILSIILTLFLMTGTVCADVQNIQAADTSGRTAAIHDIFYPADNSKIEKFKARILNRILYPDPAIDVSDLVILPEEITCSTALGEGTGEWAVSYTYHPSWKTEFVEKVIAGYDEAMALIQPEDGDFAKILKFHDWIVKNVSYGLLGGYADFAVGALGNKKAVCAGYAKLMQFFLDQSGIENIYIAAQTQTEAHTGDICQICGYDKDKDPDGGENVPGDTDASGAETTIAMLEATENPQQAYFEVPLYVTVAAVQGSSRVLAQASGSYYIANGKGAKSEIGVLKMFIEKVPGATWDTVERMPQTAREIRLSIRDYVMPALGKGTEKRRCLSMMS